MEHICFHCEQTNCLLNLSCCICLGCSVGQLQSNTTTFYPVGHFVARSFFFCHRNMHHHQSPWNMSKHKSLCSTSSEMKCTVWSLAHGMFLLCVIFIDLYFGIVSRLVMLSIALGCFRCSVTHLSGDVSEW